MKQAALISITSCQRVQTLAKLKLSDLFWNKEQRTCTFRLLELLKHSRRGMLGVVTFKKFEPDKLQCVVRVLKEYINRTKKWRKKVDRLFLSNRADHIKICHKKDSSIP